MSTLRNGSILGTCTVLFLSGFLVISCADDPANPEHHPDPDQTPPDVSGISPTPSDGSEDVSDPVYLYWTAATDTSSGIAEYRVLLDTINPPTTEIYTGSGLSCRPGFLAYETTYFWQMIATDEAGNGSASAIWSFTTAAVDDFVLVSSGTYLMGSPVDERFRYLFDRETQHSVTLSNDFRLSPYEVTEQLWDEVMGGNSVSQYPKAYVSWDEAIHFCNSLSLLRNLTPVYEYHGIGEATWDPAADGYRLPTEAEWEYACRAGSETAFANGEIMSDECHDSTLDQIGYYCGNSVDHASEVGSLIPNSWGLYDMHGNVAEWCWDVLEDFSADAVTDPVVGGYAQESGVHRLLRGGDWSTTPPWCRSASRTDTHASLSSARAGFRLARSCGRVRLRSLTLPDGAYPIARHFN